MAYGLDREDGDAEDVVDPHERVVELGSGARGAGDDGVERQVIDEVPRGVHDEEVHGRRRGGHVLLPSS